MRVVSGSLSSAAAKGIVSRFEVDEWLGEQAFLHASGDFFQMWLFVLVVGTVVTSFSPRVARSAFVTLPCKRLLSKCRP
jgi:hypothetical protein